LELSEDEIAVLEEKLRLLQEHIKEQPEITVTYFQPDEKKSGGAYVTVTGSAKRIDESRRVLILREGRQITFEDILSLI